MEISFTIDAEDYSRAWKLARKPGWRVAVASIPEFLALIKKYKLQGFD